MKKIKFFSLFVFALIAIFSFNSEIDASCFSITSEEYNNCSVSKDPYNLFVDQWDNVGVDNSNPLYVGVFNSKKPSDFDKNLYIQEIRVGNSYSDYHPAAENIKNYISNVGGTSNYLFTTADYVGNEKSAYMYVPYKENTFPLAICSRKEIMINEMDYVLGGNLVKGKLWDYVYFTVDEIKSAVASGKCKRKDLRFRYQKDIELFLGKVSDPGNIGSKPIESIGTKCVYRNAENQDDILYLYSIRTESIKDKTIRESLESNNILSLTTFAKMDFSDNSLKECSATRNSNIKTGLNCPTYVLINFLENRIEVASEETRAEYIKKGYKEVYKIYNPEDVIYLKENDINDQGLPINLSNEKLFCAPNSGNQYDSYTPICGIFKPAENGGKTLPIVKKLYSILKIAIPVLVFALTVAEFLKVLFNGEEKTMKEAFQATYKRLILMAVLIILPFIVEFVIELAGISQDCLQHII